jgi:hypothetical protein
MPPPTVLLRWKLVLLLLGVLKTAKVAKAKVAAKVAKAKVAAKVAKAKVAVVLCSREVLVAVLR